MNNIEIPFKEDRSKRYLFFEKLPGITSWTILFSPLVLGVFWPTALVYALIAYLLIWFAKAVGMNIRVIEGWRTLQKHQKLDWPQLVKELEAGEVTEIGAKRPKWHYDNLLRSQVQAPLFKPSQVVHAIIIASYNEGREVLEPTVKSVLNSAYDMKKVILVFAYEGRDGAQSEEAVLALTKQYGPQFMQVMAIKHPVTEGEVRGKGGNINYAAKQLHKYVIEQKIDPVHVNVTTLDSDNRPHPLYLAALSYTFASSADPTHTSYQPVALYTQNIWDVPAPMRVIATGNSFFQVVAAMRLHALRNFSAHAQPLSGLIETNFWSARTIVEDGHQFWRSYFTFDGKYQVYPIFVPIYQDAVLSATFRRTLVAQFIQLRRWAWGCSDIAYVAEMGFFRKNKVNKWDLIAKFWRLYEGHVSWATAALLVAGTAFIPSLFHPNNYAASQLPVVASRIQTVALTGIVLTFFLSILLLPPKPARYKRRRHIFMTLQWIYLPFTTIIYNGLSGLTAQTRLMFGRYIDKFDVTEKTVVVEGGKVTPKKQKT
ncbi:MAG: glycosyltransferase family 2 protein [Candidatus Saccharimonadales bacterium]